MELNKELLSKAKEAKTPEELLTLAKEYYDGNGMDEEQTYRKPCQNRGDDLLIAMHYCDEWRCKDDGSQWVIDGMLECCKTCRVTAYCHSCQYCTYEKGLWLCNNPVNMK